MSAQPVDVLAVLRRARHFARQGKAIDAGSLSAAIDVVTALIEERRALRKTLGALGVALAPDDARCGGAK